jgi:parallel beta-helix repeat protein
MFANLFRFLRTQKPVRRRPGRKSFRPVLETMEDRLAPSVVTTLEDGGAGSLRQAILDANAHGGDTITFAVAGTINVGSTGLGGLPTVTAPVTIDGNMQVVISGGGADMDGLVLQGGNSLVQGLIINGFGIPTGYRTASGTQIHVESGGNTIQGNYLGTDSSGMAAMGGGFGVAIDNGGANNTVSSNLISGNNGSGVILGSDSNNLIENNMIGVNATGTQALANAIDGVTIGDHGSQNVIKDNLLSGNAYFGVYVFNSGANSNLVVGNTIGTNLARTAALPNGGGVGVDVGATNTIIGGTTSADRNLISGNAGDGVDIASSGTTGTLVEGNYIGTTPDGTAALSNQNGIAVFSGATGNTVGGTQPGARNVISGNRGYGLDMIGSGTTGNVVQGNNIGTNAAGTAALPNGDRGVIIQASAADNTIGGTAAGAGNLISGNMGRGVDIFGSGTTGNQVLGNHIGTTLDGTAALPNSDDGVAIDFGATANIIGGTAAGAGNLISGNTNNGVEMFGDGTANNQVLGNYIGTDVTGTSALGNHGNGVAIGGTGVNNNTVGGTAAGAGNLIAGNAQTGVVISVGASANLVQGNLVGTDVSGARALANTWWGLVIASFGTETSNNTVGGTTAAARNVISGNGFSGVYLWDVSGNAVQGNYIGTDVTGAQALANGGDGVTVSGNNNLIGGTASGAGNLIAGNSGSGVSISSGSTGSTANLVQGNLIGTDVMGTRALGNHSNGVAIGGIGVNNTTVGGTAAGAGNLIAGNAQTGVVISVGASGNLVQGNLIGTDIYGARALANTWWGVVIASFGTETSNNTIGGTTPAARNVISGNGFSGVYLWDVSGNAVQGNYIGTDVSGAQALANGGDGVTVSGNNNMIGGTASGAGNLIAGNRGSGVSISSGSTGSTANLVQGNLIGTDVTRMQALANHGDGVAVSGTGTNNNTIGGTVSGAGNTIAFNANDGVLVDTGTGNAIQQNRIHDSGNLGIELINGGNNNQAFPVLTSATSDGVNTTITGSLSSAPGTSYTLEFFANQVPNPSGHGEGQQPLGFFTVNTDDSGNATFTATFTGNTTGQWIAATATDPANNTSSFSQDVMVNAPDSPSHPRLDLRPAAFAGRAQKGPDPLLAAQSAPASPDPEAQAGPILPREVVDQVFGGGRVEDGLEAFAFYPRAMLPGTDSDTALWSSGL